MKHSTGKPTKSEVLRFDKLRIKVGCIACFIKHRFEDCGVVEIHHLLSGNKRRGHEFTIPLGAWHHRAVTRDSTMSMDTATRLYGPSLANGSKPFHAAFGSDDSLLAQVNRMIGEP